MIDVKIVGNRFVTCYPAPPPKLDDEPTFLQHLVLSKNERRRLRPIGDGVSAMGDYIRAKADQA